MAIQRLSYQSNVAAAASVLERVASEPTDLDPSAEIPLSEVAIMSLITMGADGRAALQRLHASKVVSNIQARAALEAFARNSFGVIR
jgi:hypothetical protein